MLIFFGVKYRMGDYLVYTNNKCRCCEAEDSITVLPYHGYFHLFWIPTFPVGTQYEIACQKCNTQYNKYQIEIDKDTKKEIKKPVWLFSGLFIILTFIAFIAISASISGADKKRELEEFVNNPKSGVLLEAKMDKEYTLINVIRVTDDSVFVRYHEYVAQRKSQLSDLQKGIYNNAFDEDVIPYSKSGLKGMAEQGYIIGIHK